MKLIMIFIVKSLLFYGIFFQSEDRISNIDKARQEIDAVLESCYKIEKQNDSLGTRYIYVKDNELQLITFEYKDKKIYKKTEWYFQKGQLIFSEQIVKNNLTNKLADDQKFYVNNNHLLAWFKFESKVDPASAEFKIVDDKLFIETDRLKDDYKK